MKNQFVFLKLNSFVFLVSSHLWRYASYVLHSMIMSTEYPIVDFR